MGRQDDVQPLIRAALDRAEKVDDEAIAAELRDAVQPGGLRVAQKAPRA